MSAAVSVCKGVTFSDGDVVNPDDFVPNKGESNPNVRPFLMHDHGFVVAVVFADCLDNAMHIAVDSGKFDRYTVDTSDKVLMAEEYPNENGITFLGNAGEPFDIESLEVIELSNPKFSFVALFNADASK